MTEIIGWFPKESEVFLETLIKENNIRTVVEIGSFVGKSTVFFAQHCDKVYAIDPFVVWEDSQANGDVLRYGADFFGKFVSNIVEAGVEDKVSIIRLKSEEANIAFPELTADLIYIDGSHMYENVKKDIQMWLPKATKIICGDDYDENWKGVVQAVDEVVPNKLINNRIWYIKK